MNILHGPPGSLFIDGTACGECCYAERWAHDLAAAQAEVARLKGICENAVKIVKEGRWNTWSHYGESRDGLLPAGIVDIVLSELAKVDSERDA